MPSASRSFHTTPVKAPLAGVIAVSTVDVLFVGTGSGVVELTTTVLVSVVADGVFGASTAISMVRVSPGSSVPTAHVTVPTACVQPADAETNVVPAGSASVMVTPVAVDGPPLVTDNVYVKFEFPTTFAGAFFTTLTSAEGVVGSVVVSVLFVGTGSGVVEVTVPVFTTSPVRLWSLRTSSVMVAVASTASAPSSHVTDVVVFVHDPTDVVTLTTVRPAGKVSLTTTSVATDGPAFDTTKV